MSQASSFKLQTNNSLSIKEVFKQAWSLVHGTKGAIWTGMAVLFVIAIIIFCVALSSLPIGKSSFGSSDQLTFMTLLPVSFLVVLLYLVLAPLVAGMYMVGVRRVRGQAIKLSSPFSYFNKWFPVTLAFLLIVSFGMGVYFLSPLLVKGMTASLYSFPLLTMLIKLGVSVAMTGVSIFFYFTLFFVVDQNSSPWQAIKNSVLLVKSYWGKILLIALIFKCAAILVGLLLGFLMGLLIVVGFGFFASLIGLIGFSIFFIWFVPYLFLVFSVVYCKLVDCAQQDSNSSAITSSEAGSFKLSFAKEKPADVFVFASLVLLLSIGVTFFIKQIPDKIAQRQLAAMGRILERSDYGEADYQLAQFYRFGIDGKGTGKDIYKAAFWMKKAADEGVVYAITDLGVMYHAGAGVQKNEEKALALYKKASNLGDAMASYNAGFNYFKGEGVPVNYQKALQLYQKARQQGEDMFCAPHDLGVMYAKGLGVTPDKAQSEAYFSEALNEAFRYDKDDLPLNMKTNMDSPSFNGSAEETKYAHAMYLKYSSEPLNLNPNFDKSKSISTAEQYEKFMIEKCWG